VNLDRRRFVSRSLGGFVFVVSTPEAGGPSAESFDKPSPRQLARGFVPPLRFALPVLALAFRCVGHSSSGIVALLAEDYISVRLSGGLRVSLPQFAPHDLGDPVDDRAGGLGIRGLNHHAHERLGARGTHQNAAVLAKLFLGSADGVVYGRAAREQTLVGHMHVLQDLRVAVHHLAQLGKRLIGLANDRGKIDTPLPGRDGHPVPALTRYQVIERFSQVTLVRVAIETGRLHQIRLHFAALGHPVVMDDQHGDFGFNKQFRKDYGLKRQFLHAQALKIAIAGTWQQWTAPLSQDLQKVLLRLTD